MCSLSLSFVRLVSIVTLLIATSLAAMAQGEPCDQQIASTCSTQVAPNCDNCVYSIVEFTVCHAGQEYAAEVTLCTQYATTAPIDNPCTPDCATGLDAITWVRSFCVDPNLKAFGVETIYAAIIQATNLCCPDGNFLGVTIPNCTPNGTNCKTSWLAFSHILALPKCLKKNYVTGCYDYCGNGCNDYCMVERRYCRQGEGGPCCRAFRVTCAYNNDGHCATNCNPSLTFCCENLTDGGTTCCGD